MAGGYDVKKTDTLGMAQRGGSVISHVRIAPKVYSPLIKDGEANLIFAFEKLEAARWGYFLKPGGTVIVNDQALPPLSVNLGREIYPDDSEIKIILKRQTEAVYFVDGSKEATELGNIRALNIFMLGCASVFMPFKVELWKEIISGHFSGAAGKLNLLAFDRGRKVVKNAHI